MKKTLLLPLMALLVPMLACVSSAKLDELIVSGAIDALAGLELNTLIEEDGAGTLQLAFGARPVELPTESGPELIRPDLFMDCVDLGRDVMAPVGPAYTVAQETRGEELWCLMEIPFADLHELQTLYARFTAVEDSVVPSMDINCLQLVNGRLYYDVNIAQNPELAEVAARFAPFPFSARWQVNTAGRIDTTNALRVDDGTATWDLFSVSDAFRVNLTADAPCPQGQVTLDLAITAEDSGMATLTVPVAPGEDARIVAESLRDVLTFAGWSAQVQGTGPLTVVAGRVFAPAQLNAVLGTIPGFNGSGLTTASWQVDDADPAQTVYTLDLTLHFNIFNEVWRAELVNRVPDGFVLTVDLFGQRQETLGDWTDPSTPAFARAKDDGELFGMTVVHAVAHADLGTSTVMTTTAVTSTAPVTVTAPVSPTVVPTGAVNTPGQHPLCAEAVAFGDLMASTSPGWLKRGGISDPQKSKILIDNRFLQADFAQAIRNHNTKNPDNSAFASMVLSSVAQLEWLADHNGVLFKKNQAVLSQFVTGQEDNLRQAIVAKSTAKQQAGEKIVQLTPGEVLELALELTQGDATAAMLTAHNTLRALARGDGTSPDWEEDNAQVTNGLLGFGKDKAFFDQYLIKLRDRSDNAGPWYHMFGMAYYEMAARGGSNLGMYSSFGLIGARFGHEFASLPGAKAGALIGVVLAGIFDVLNESDAFDASIESIFANGLEQAVREGIEGNTPDPEKFCFNVWGSELGKSVYEELPFRLTRSIRSEPFAKFSAPPPTDPSFTHDIARARFLNYVKSPFAIQWEDETGRMVFDQGASLADAAIYGTVPMFMMAIPEESSWAVFWLSPDDRTQTVTFEATEPDAELHFTRVDLTTGDVAYYETVVADAGDRLQVQYDVAMVAPAMTAPDGTQVEPETFRVDLPELDVLDNEGSLLYAEDFADPDSGWDVGISRRNTWGYEDGQYAIGVRRPESAVISMGPEELFEDFVLDVDMIFGDGAAADVAGLHFRAADERTYWEAMLSPGGALRLSRVLDGQAETVTVDAAEAMADDGSVNQLRVVAVGGIVQLYVNEQLLAEEPDEMPLAGTIALAARTTAGARSLEVAFDNLVIRTPALSQEPQRLSFAHEFVDSYRATSYFEFGNEVPETILESTADVTVGAEPGAVDFAQTSTLTHSQDGRQETVTFDVVAKDGQVFVRQSDNAAWQTESRADFRNPEQTMVDPSSTVLGHLAELLGVMEEVGVARIGAQETVHQRAVVDEFAGEPVVAGRFDLWVAAAGGYVVAMEADLEFADGYLYVYYEIGDIDAPVDIALPGELESTSEDDASAVTPTPAPLATATSLPAVTPTPLPTSTPQPTQQPTATPAPALAPVSVVAPAVSTAFPDARLITGFDGSATWARGDEPYGTLDQVVDGGGSNYVGRLRYAIPAGVSNSYVVFRRTLPVDGEVQALQLQVYGDGAGHFLNAWVQDANGELFQFTFGRVEHEGWETLTAPLDLTRGWPNEAITGADAAYVFPLRVYALVLDSPLETAQEGTIYLDNLQALYGVVDAAAPTLTPAPISAPPAAAPPPGPSAERLLVNGTWTEQVSGGAVRAFETTAALTVDPAAGVVAGTLSGAAYDPENPNVMCNGSPVTAAVRTSYTVAVSGTVDAAGNLDAAIEPAGVAVVESGDCNGVAFDWRGSGRLTGVVDFATYAVSLTTEWQAGSAVASGAWTGIATPE